MLCAGRTGKRVPARAAAAPFRDRRCYVLVDNHWQSQWQQKALAMSVGTILIADRGYEVYNNMAHIEQKGWKYLIRVKNKQGILSSDAVVILMGLWIGWGLGRHRLNKSKLFLSWYC